MRMIAWRIMSVKIFLSDLSERIADAWRIVFVGGFYGYFYRRQTTAF